MSARGKSSPALLALAVACVLLSFPACRNRPAPVAGEPEPAREPDQYSATVIVTLDDTTDGAREDKEPVEVSRSSVFRSGDLYREEWSQGGEMRALIRRPDTGKNFLLYLDRRVYIESAIGPEAAPPADGTVAGSNGRAGGETQEPGLAFEAGEIESAFDGAPSSVETRRLPDEVIDGHSCTVLERRESFEGGQVEVTTTFSARDLDGLALRITSETDSADRRVRVIIRRGNVRTTVNPDLFTVPSDFKRVDRLF